ncbi:hypothetical protein LCGC14_2555000, partial [marine sediment metagenome]
MEKWHDEIASAGNYISTKIGTDVTIELIDIRKITNKPDYEPKTKDDTRQGFVFEFVGAEGVITASTYALQGALKDADVTIGDKINIKHPEQGKYT